MEALLDTRKKRLFSVKKGYFQPLTLVRFHLCYIFSSSLINNMCKIIWTVKYEHFCRQSS